MNSIMLQFFVSYIIGIIFWIYPPVIIGLLILWVVLILIYSTMAPDQALIVVKESFELWRFGISIAAILLADWTVYLIKRVIRRLKK